MRSSQVQGLTTLAEHPGRCAAALAATLVEEPGGRMIIVDGVKEEREASRSDVLVLL